MAFSMARAVARAGAGDETDHARERLAGFRRELYRCFTARADALCELGDAALCKQDRVHMLAELSLEPGHQRGHGALYDALNCGKVQAWRLRWALAGVPLPAWDDGRIRLAVDVSNWLRPDAATSPGRSFCHCYGRVKRVGRSGMGPAAVMVHVPVRRVAIVRLWTTGGASALRSASCRAACIPSGRR
ncbi:MAG TPA: transposase [Streptosporangiaceae bacterium]|nr:transposase [Streptosporangiaceae bacterium]